MPCKLASGYRGGYPLEFTSKGNPKTLLGFMKHLLIPRLCRQDNGNIGAGNLIPLGLFFVIFGIGACFGWETGYAINLARDFGPRLMSYCLGYGHHVWQAGGHYFWVRSLMFTTRFVLMICRSQWWLHSSDAHSEAGCTMCSSSLVWTVYTRNILLKLMFC